MGKSAKILPFSPSSKSEKPLKKDRSEVMKKVWATRRANEAKAAKAGRKKPIRKTAKRRSPIERVASEVLTPRSEARAERMLDMATDGMIASTIADETRAEARAILAEARKGGEKAVTERLHRAVMRAHQRTSKHEQERTNAEISAISRLTVERSVCGFIAEVEMAMRLHRGLPNDLVWNVSSYTVSKILEALHEAGYSAKGRRPQPE